MLLLICCLGNRKALRTLHKSSDEAETERAHSPHRPLAMKLVRGLSRHSVIDTCRRPKRFISVCSPWLAFALHSIAYAVCSPCLTPQSTTILSSCKPTLRSVDGSVDWQSVLTCSALSGWLRSVRREYMTTQQSETGLRREQAGTGLLANTSLIHPSQLLASS